jgi:hypothetical protein
MPGSNEAPAVVGITPSDTASVKFPPEERPVSGPRSITGLLVK